MGPLRENKKIRERQSNHKKLKIHAQIPSMTETMPGACSGIPLQTLRQ
jgi:hypothetical protein